MNEISFKWYSTSIVIKMIKIVWMYQRGRSEYLPLWYIVLFVLLLNTYPFGTLYCLSFFWIPTPLVHCIVCPSSEYLPLWYIVLFVLLLNTYPFGTLYCLSRRLTDTNTVDQGCKVMTIPHMKDNWHKHCWPRM
jgi:hypothetical protein